MLSKSKATAQNPKPIKDTIFGDSLLLLEAIETRPSKTVMADWHGIMGKSSASIFSRRPMRDEDFEEEDVWSVVMKERGDSSPKMRKSKDCSSSSSSSAWCLHSSPRMIPRTNVVNSPTITAAATTTTTPEAKLVQQSSAPVNIPDWSKIYGKNTRMHSWAADDNDDVDDDNVKNYHHEYYNDDVNDIDHGDDDDGMVPPHEWIARKLARSQISSFSVCEGIGRTLKGRDLSKVRNAILTKTGFLE